jgi:hypothetical protein
MNPLLNVDLKIGFGQLIHIVSPVVRVKVLD